MNPAGDAWAAGDAYEAYMGRWSRALAAVFLGWLRPGEGGHWLDVGCGTGALTAAICAGARPASVMGCDPSAPFIQHARGALPTCQFHVMAAEQDLPRRPDGFDVVVAGLALNFTKDPASALALMRERTRPGGTVAAYVWDYGGGVQFLRHFWQAAVAGDPAAAALDESQRFADWQPPRLAGLFAQAGLTDTAQTALDVPTTFADFDDYWRPFLAGVGPAPSYVATLSPGQRESLRARLERDLPRADGRILLQARALAICGRAALP
jgi:SAM-dependent methyltransferase